MIRKFQRQDLEAAVKIWLAANKEAHDFIDPCYWEGYKDAVKDVFAGGNLCFRDRRHDGRDI